MGYYDSEKVKELVGKKVTNVYFNERYLRFDTDKGALIYEAEGDCCSHSYFYDFYGVKKLLENGPVTEVKEIELQPDDIFDPRETGDSYYCCEKDKKMAADDIKVYGVAITTESHVYGEQTSVFSFRNYSNGYYGGWVSKVDEPMEVKPEIFDDVTESVTYQDNK